MNKSDVESFLFSLLEQTINGEDPLCGFASELGIEDIWVNYEKKLELRTKDGYIVTLDVDIQKYAIPVDNIRSPHYYDNISREGEKDHNCVICGKILEKPCLWIRVGDYGNCFVLPDILLKEGSGLGLHPVGQNCAKKYPELENFVVKGDNKCQT